MNLKLIGCKIIQREIASILWQCPNVVDVTLLKQDYHEIPEIMRRVLQEEIDTIDNNSSRYTNDLERNDVDAILMGYGLCSNALVGLKSKKYPMIIPKAHDCATLLMGSKETYKDYFEHSGGSYFYSQGWIELGLNKDEQHMEELRKKYMEKYEDEETVEYLMSVEEEMLKNYDCATFVSWKGMAKEGCDEKVKEIARQRNWKYQHIEGNNSLLKDLLYGNWDEQRFLTVMPGGEIVPSYDDEVIKVKYD